MLGKNIRIMRKHLGISQNKLSKILSVSQQAVCKWESGASEPDLSTLLKLADIFSVSTDYLLGKEHYISSLTNSEHEIVQIFKQLSNQQQNTVLAYANGVLDSKK